jgi:hypothetical protein
LSLKILVQSINQKKQLSLFLTYSLFLNVYLFLSVFEPNFSYPIVYYSVNFYIYEILTAILFLYGALSRNFFLRHGICKKSNQIGLLQVLVIVFLIIDNFSALIITLFFIGVNFSLSFRFIRLVLSFLNKNFHLILFVFLAIFLLNYYLNNPFKLLTTILSGETVGREAFHLINESRTSYQSDNPSYQSGNIIIRQIFAMLSFSLIPFLSYYYLEKLFDICSRRKVPKFKIIFQFFLFVIFFSMGTLTAISTLGKSRIVYFFIGIILLTSFYFILQSPKKSKSILPHKSYTLYAKKKSSSISVQEKFKIFILFVVVLIIGFGLIGFMYLFTAMSNNIQDFINSFFIRLFSVPVQANAAYFNFIDSNNNFIDSNNFRLPVNVITRFISPLLDMLGINLSSSSIDTDVSVKLTGIKYGLVSSGFSSSYAQLGILSILITTGFIFTLLNIDRILILEFSGNSENNKVFYSVYFYLLVMMPVTVTVSYSQALYLFGLFIIPCVYISLKKIDK